ncbi:MAG: hypothetical protein A3F11_00330 [Gammaproteobacteria bacterium RIFCSPHIGHO2_12_FULL_37_14]|nr:MAG: hypothetical protein A3F11_00330 [Gammaproteobacteria bacterium RIFCSPHIGHO2_12_FULL_37_14]
MNRKTILMTYILNSTPIMLPILSFIFLITFVSMLPGTASDKEGWGFRIAFLMIPILIFSGILFLISVINTLFSKNIYLYILSFIVIAYYATIAVLLKTEATTDINFWVIIFGAILYICLFIIFCKCDKTLRKVR